MQIILILFFALLSFSSHVFGFAQRPQTYNFTEYQNVPGQNTALRFPMQGYGSSEWCPPGTATSGYSPPYTGFFGGNASRMSDIQYAIAAQGGPTAQALVNKAMAQVSCPPRNIGKGAGYCSLNGYRASSYDCAYYVRKALEGTLLPTNAGGLGNAKDMGCGLQRYGMRNLCGNGCSRGSSTCNISPYNAPEGAVLIYDNVGSGCHPAGHAEIRTSNGFVSDYASSRPRNESSSCRRLIGIWVK